MTNRKLTFILIPIIPVLVILFIYILIQIKKNEESKVFFDASGLNNIVWKNESDKLEVKRNRITIVINDEVIVSNKKFDIDSRTGKFDISGFDEDIYLRSKNDDYIVIWYEKSDYHLDKEKIYK